MEQILSITESQDTGYNGYEIKTNEQVIKLQISNGQSCCESYGHFMSEDDLDEFIGADLISVSIVDDALEKVKLEHADELEVYDGGVMFVNLETSKGLLQFVAYNAHNGYYGHEAKVVSRQVTKEACL